MEISIIGGRRRIDSIPITIRVGTVTNLLVFHLLFPPVVPHIVVVFPLLVPRCVVIIPMMNKAVGMVFGWFPRSRWGIPTVRSMSSISRVVMEVIVLLLLIQNGIVVVMEE